MFVESDSCSIEEDEAAESQIRDERRAARAKAGSAETANEVGNGSAEPRVEVVRTSEAMTRVCESYS
jgi:hypothetical protein